MLNQITALKNALVSVCFVILGGVVNVLVMIMAFCLVNLEEHCVDVTVKYKFGGL